MHYTALHGTIFYRPNTAGPPPVPKLQTPALIGVISAIVVSACIGLLYVSIKTGIKNLPLYSKNTNKRLILDAVIFDPIGRILVKIDGTLPMTEIVHNLELNVKFLLLLLFFLLIFFNRKPNNHLLQNIHCLFDCSKLQSTKLRLNIILIRGPQAYQARLPSKLMTRLKNSS